MTNISNRSKTRGTVAALVALSLAVLPLSGAQAVAGTISGGTPVGGVIQNYATLHYHITGGMNITPTFVAPCGGFTALWARNGSNVRITNQPNLYVGVTTTWTTPGGSTTIAPQYFRLSSHTIGAGCSSADQYFAASWNY